MGDWNSSIEAQDVEFLLDICDDWEEDGACSQVRMIEWLKRFDESNIESIPEEIRDGAVAILKKIKEDLMPNEKLLRRKAKIRKERAVLIKAKLILLQQKLTAEAALNDFQDSDDDDDDED